MLPLYKRYACSLLSIFITSMQSNTTTVFILLLILLPVILTSPLTDLYKQAIQRRETILEDKLTNLIRSSVPSGIDAALPKIAEYETFRQSPEANFIHDGNGKLHFRQFRRINLNTVMSQRSGV